MQNRFACVSSVRGEQRLFFRTVSKRTWLTWLFGSFAFLQFTVLGIANHAGAGYLSTSRREQIYYALQVFVILGYLLYSLFYHFCSEKRFRKAFSYAVCCVFFVCVSMMLIVDSASLLSVIVSMLAALCLGGIGGAVHLRMSLGTAAGADTAHCMGLGSAAAVVLQYLLQIREVPAPVLSLFMMASLFLVMIQLQKCPANSPEEKIKEKISPKRILFSVLITVIFLFFACFYNEYIHHLQIQSGYESYNVYSWPRLMLIPGYLLFAVIGDRKNGRYVSLASLCMMLIALLNVVLTGNSEMYWLNMCLFYFVIGVFTSYYLLTFWRLALGTKHPALWAPMGRILDSAVVLLTGALRLDRLPVPLILGVDIIGVAMVILMMALEGDFNLFGPEAPETQPVLLHGSEADSAMPVVLSTVPEALPEKPENVSSVPEAVSEIPAEVPLLLSPEETLARMQERYLLTPRETAVLRELVLTEDKQVAISERLSIRVKTLQDYVTRLYRKTGAATRAGLTDLYHENRIRN